MSKMSKTIAVLGVVAALGVTALPLSTYAVDPVSKDATVRATIEETLSMTLAGTKVEGEGEAAKTIVDLGTLTPDGQIETADLTATVKTNNKAGYKLELIDKEGTNEMVSTTVPADTIPAGVPAVGQSFWGFTKGTTSLAAGATDISTLTEGTYAAVPASDGTAAVIVNSDKPTKVDADDATKSGDTAVITFGASASSAQAAGTYEAVVTVTATAN